LSTMHVQMCTLNRCCDISVHICCRHCSLPRLLPLPRRALSCSFRIAGRTIEVNLRIADYALLRVFRVSRGSKLSKNGESTRETGHMQPLWRAWQRDAESAAGELERDSALKDLALWEGCSRADIHMCLCLFVSTHISYTSEMTCICIPSNSWQNFSPCTHRFIHTYIHTYLHYDMDTHLDR